MNRRGAVILLVALCACAAISVCHASVHHRANKHSHASSELHEHQQKFASFMKTYSKEYSSESEHAIRFGHFRASLARAAASNAKHNTDVFGITPFSDMSEAEFAARYRTYRPVGEMNEDFLAGRALLTLGEDALDATEEKDDDIPDTFDWRDAGVVTNVNNQQECGACWAFSAVETIESSFLLSRPDYLPLVSGGWGFSVEQVISCVDFIILGGCSGGWADLAYEYVKGSGIMNATSDPFDGTFGWCPYNATQEAVTKAGNYTFATPPCLFNCKEQRMDLLQRTVALVAPVSVCLNTDNWADYTGGVLPASSCSSDFINMDHCVQVVGYSINATAPDQSYWLVRNSWGSSWGVDGYIHLQLNMSVNTCGVANQATNIPIVPIDEEADYLQEA